MNIARSMPLIMLSFPLLAGCIGEDAPTAAVAENQPTTVVTRPDDVAALKNSSSGWHVHDYWGGQTRLTVINEEISVVERCNGCEDGMRFRFRGEPGMIVPGGTAELEVEASWKERGQSAYEPPELWVKTAADREPWRVAPLENGRPLRINTTNDWNDPPHQILSRWEFWVVFPSENGTYNFDGTIRLFAEAIRGGDIPPFPPHQDLWNGLSELVVLDTQASALQIENRLDNWRMCGPCIDAHVPHDGVLVPWDSREVVITLRSYSALPLLGLKVHGADTWEMTEAYGELSLPDAMVFRVPVTPQSGDSPYARQSLWEFLVHVAAPAPAVAFAGEYHLYVLAVK